jgi:hypothetical protein
MMRYVGTVILIPLWRGEFHYMRGSASSAGVNQKGKSAAKLLIRRNAATHDARSAALFEYSA